MTIDEQVLTGITRAQQVENALSDLLDLVDEGSLVVDPDLDDDDAAYITAEVDRLAVVLSDTDGEE